MNVEITIARTAEDIENCRKAIQQFRPMVDPDKLLSQTLDMMSRDDFKLAYIKQGANGQAVAIVGYRCYEMFRTGKMIYIDDLYTLDEFRGKGYASLLLDYVAVQAKIEGIQTVHLDSGYHLFPAHRLYLGKGYVLGCHHFVKKI